MREILFRGKRVDNGEWAYGYYANCRKPGGNQHKTGHYIIEYPGVYHEIYTKTVGQYTGRTDKNGKNIFEGDILNYWDGCDEVPYLCLWQDNGWKVKQYDIDASDDLDASFCEDARVVGNVHDNPELIQEAAP